MTRYLLCVVVFVAASAQAPLVYPCGTANCVGVGVPDGGPVQQAAILQTSRYVLPDAGLPRVRIQPLSPLTQVEILGAQARTSTEPDVIIGGLSARDGGQGPIVSFRTGSYEVATITTGGFSGTTTGPVNATTITGSGPTNITGVTSLAALDAGVRSKVGGATIGAIQAQDGGISTQLCQHGYIALTSGDAGIVFRSAFTSIPSCNCTHIATTNANPCVISTAPTTTAVGLSALNGATDVINFICCGDL